MKPNVIFRTPTNRNPHRKAKCDFKDSSQYKATPESNIAGHMISVWLYSTGPLLCFCHIACVASLLLKASKDKLQGVKIQSVKPNVIFRTPTNRNPHRKATEMDT